MLNDGNAVFTISSYHSLFGLGGGDNVPTVIALGDLDGDGDLDMVYGGDGGGNMILNLGSQGFHLPSACGSGTRDFGFGSYIRRPTPDGSYNHIPAETRFCSDFSAHIGCQTCNPVCNEYRSPICPFNFPTGLFARAIALADIDGDGDLDILVGERGFNELLLNSNAGARWSRSWGADWGARPASGFGYFESSASFSANTSRATATTNSVAFADVDGDGDLDVVVGNTEANELQLHVHLPPSPATSPI